MQSVHQNVSTEQEGSCQMSYRQYFSLINIFRIPFKIHFQNNLLVSAVQRLCCWSAMVRVMGQKCKQFFCQTTV